MAKVAEENPKEAKRIWAVPRLQNVSPRNVQKVDSLSKPEDLETDMSDIESNMPPPPPPLSPPVPPVEFTAVPAKPVQQSPSPSLKNVLPPISAKSFTICRSPAVHEQLFTRESHRKRHLGSVYRAELPNGKFLAVKNLDKRASDQQKDDEFLHLVNDIDKIRHANVIELMGYCADHGQRLLIYEYCSNGTLQDAFHADDEFKKNNCPGIPELEWLLKLTAAFVPFYRYLHEVRQPPIVHRNFKSVNLLLDHDLSVHVSDCGLAPLISLGSVSQLSGHLLSACGYGAPEFESGIYTIRSDVYSFGVVMLELLTGRKSYDRQNLLENSDIRTRNRGEQFLVRWAIPQLHDIDALSRMVAPSMKGQYPNKSSSCFTDIISICIQSKPEFRQPMSKVVQDLLDMIRRKPPCEGLRDGPRCNDLRNGESYSYILFG